MIRSFTLANGILYEPPPPPSPASEKTEIAKIEFCTSYFYGISFVHSFVRSLFFPLLLDFIYLNGITFRKTTERATKKKKSENQTKKQRNVNQILGFQARVCMHT